MVLYVSVVGKLLREYSSQSDRVTQENHRDWSFDRFILRRDALIKLGSQQDYVLECTDTISGVRPTGRYHQSLTLWHPSDAKRCFYEKNHRVGRRFSGSVVSSRVLVYGASFSKKMS